MQNKALLRIIKIARPILKRNKVVHAGIFGSAARGELTKGSDVDFLITFKWTRSLLDLVRLRDELQSILKRNVDVLTYGSVHPLLKKSIFKDEIKIL